MENMRMVIYMETQNLGEDQAGWRGRHERK